MWDFDVMMEKRRAEMKKRRKRRKDVDFINDSDDMIEDMMKTMREAAEVTPYVICSIVFKF